MPLDFFTQTQNLLLLSIAVISGIGLIWPLVRPAGNEVSPGQATLLINREDAHVIDVREAAEFSGMRSGKAGSELKKLGFTRIYNLAGGIDAWVGAGYPVKKGTRER